MSKHTIDIITLICNVFTAIGTVGAVIISLWFSYRERKPKLSIFADIYTHGRDRVSSLKLYECTPNFNKPVLLLSCTNTGYQPILINRLAWTHNRFDKEASIDPNPNFEQKDYSENSMPATLKYSERVEQFFDFEFFVLTTNKYIGKSRWLAKMRLKMRLKLFSRIIARTNIKEFEGKLSKSLIDKILDIHFDKK